MSRNDASAPRLLLDALHEDVLAAISEHLYVGPMLAAEPARFEPQSRSRDALRWTGRDIRALAQSNRQIAGALRQPTGSPYQAVRLDTKTAANTFASMLRHGRVNGDDIRQLHLPIEELFSRSTFPTDYDVNQYLMYGPALRTIFQHATKIETLFLTKIRKSDRYPGIMLPFQEWRDDALDNFVLKIIRDLFHSEFSFEYLSNLTICCHRYLDHDEHFSEELPLINLTRLNCVTWVPTSPTLFGEGVYDSLEVLRLSDLQDMIRFEDDDRDFPIAAEVVPDFARMLQGWVQDYNALEILVLEFDKMDELFPPDHAEGPRWWERTWPADWTRVFSVRDMVAEQIDGRGRSFFDHTTRSVRHFPPIQELPHSVAEVQTMRNKSYHGQFERRLLYWQAIHDFKVNLEASVRAGRKKDNNDTPFQVRIAASRHIVDEADEHRCKNYSLYAAQHCDDLSAFSDLDIFELVRQYPFLGFRFATDEAGKRYAYWTGILPPPPGLELITPE